MRIASLFDVTSAKTGVESLVGSEHRLFLYLDLVWIVSGSSQLTRTFAQNEVVSEFSYLPVLSAYYQLH